MTMPGGSAAGFTVTRNQTQYSERSRVDEDAETACAQSKETTKLGEIVFAVSQDRIREHWTVGAQCGVVGNIEIGCVTAGSAYAAGAAAMSGMVPPGPMTFVDFRLAPALFSRKDLSGAVI